MSRETENILLGKLEGDRVEAVIGWEVRCICGSPSDLLTFFGGGDKFAKNEKLPLSATQIEPDCSGSRPFRSPAVDPGLPGLEHFEVVPARRDRSRWFVKCSG